MPYIFFAILPTPYWNQYWEHEDLYSNFPAQVYNLVLPQNLSAYNTRLFKKESEGKRCYEVRLASAVKKGEEIKTEYSKMNLIYR